jgi:hypothetical protein
MRCNIEADESMQPVPEKTAMAMKLRMKRKPEGGPRRNRTYRLPDLLVAQLEMLAERNRRAVTTEIEIALEQYLERNGLWPVPPPEPPKKK